MSRRPSPDRARYIPTGATIVRHKQSDAVAYIATRTRSDGRTYYTLTAFCGRRQRPDLHFSYISRRQRDSRLIGYFNDRVAALERQRASRAQRNIPARLTVGTVLTGSWGYDQTNVEAWQVVETVGNTMVSIRRVKTTSLNPTGHMSEYVIPCPDQFADDKVLRKRVRDGTRISLDHCTLRPWSGGKLYSSWYA